jgi:oxygen-independent coproporphyrinogen-3 oxidase
MRQFETIDRDLFRKYSGPGPRYTSYPTAPVFSPSFGPDAYLEEIRRTNAGNGAAPLSLYTHLPFCDTLCYFCGCTMLVTHSRGQISEYNRHLIREIEMIGRLVSRDRVVAQMHWGGGSPSYLSPEEIRQVGDAFRRQFTYADDIEAGVEIDPRGLTFGHMQAFREAGFNRVSLGVQDYDETVQVAVNRVQSERITTDAVEWSRKLGFKSLNVDLIYGLPHQTIEGFQETVRKVLLLDPDRLAVFHYAHVPWLKPHQKLITEDVLPTVEQKIDMFIATTEILTSAGYWNIGMDHFAKADDELAVAQRNGTLQRNFQGYSTKAGCDLYGFGMSAIGQFTDTYQQNAKRLPEYYAAVEAGRPATIAGYRMVPDDHVRKDVIMQLMCHMKLDKRDMERRHGIVFDDYFSSALERLRGFAADGLVEVDADRIAVNGIGRLVIRNIAMAFDAYIGRMVQDRPVFSKTL